ncbi:MAG: class I SAM-dependent methyltransferase [Verrucomicrobiales bacterium]|nr:class I SAM-dependent methyltransferase [Verrucomicrobiales bacterium]
MAADWEKVSCALCQSTDGTSVLAIPQPDAPGGMAHVWQCRQCGLRRLEPRPSLRSLPDYYAAASGYNAYIGRTRSPRTQRLWNLLRDGYSRPAGLGPWTRLTAPLGRAIASWAFDINIPLNGIRGLRVLEIGSGYGDILIYLKERGCEVLGIDPSQDAAASGRRHGVEIRVGFVTQLDLPAASFDAVIMCHSLEHVPDPNVELAEVARLLTPGGHLHLAVPNGNAVRLRQDGIRWAHLSHPLHLWYFDAATLTQLLRRHGLEPIHPPVTTTRHHALKHWIGECRNGHPFSGTRRFLKFLWAAAGSQDGGDVLRAVAKKTGPSGGTPERSR